MTCLLVFSHLRWGFVFQRPQHLLTRLAPHLKVCFVEEPTRSDGPARIDAVEKADGLEVLTPHTPVEAPGFHDDQLSVLQPLLADFLRERGIDDYLVWFYTPMALPLMAQLRPRAVVYDCMDELAAFKDAPRQLRQRETALMKIADLVLCGGPALYESKRASHANAHCLPSSVDAAHFAPSRLDPASAEARRADALQGTIAGPRLGFFGVIDERLDVELLGRIAAARPQWQFVMVGPVVKIDPARLPRAGNVHWLGMQGYDLLPHLMAGWDVCLMPFALNESTRFISPTKTLEYLAGGKPVVSTPVHDVVGLYGDAVRIARDEADFIAACEAVLAETPAERDARLERARKTVARSSWKRAAERVHELLQAELAESPVPVPALAVLRDPAVVAAGEAAPIAAAGGRMAHAVRHRVIGAAAAGLAAAAPLPAASAVGAERLAVDRQDGVAAGARAVEPSRLKKV